MVDAAASGQIARRKQGTAAAAGGGKAIAVTLEGGLDAYRRLAEKAVLAPPQNPDWLKAWLDNHRSEAVFAMFHAGGEPVFALGLELVRRGRCKVARIIGNGHANANFPPMARALSTSEAAGCAAALVAELRRNRPDIDLIALERMAPSLDGIGNPLLALPHTTSPNVALAVNLRGGFDAVLAGAPRPSKRRKRHRYQSRNLSRLGGIEHLEARTPEEANEILDAFFAMKSVRLAKLGIKNPFASAAMQGFFRQLFAEAAAMPEPRFILNALKVGGEFVAVTGSSRRGKRLNCDFAAVSDGDAAKHSPGDFLFHANIEAACRDGYDVYDFGIGDEPYKRNWCDLETEHFDVWVPLTFRGRILAAKLRIAARLKAAIKNNPPAWRLLKSIRGFLPRSGD